MLDLRRTFANTMAAGDLTNMQKHINLSPMPTDTKTVTLHGCLVPLRDLTAHLRSTGIEYASLAAGANERNKPQTAVLLSTDIGPMLSGRETMNEFVRQAIETVVDESTCRGMARPKKTPPLAQFAASVPAFANTMAAIPDGPEMPSLPPTPVVASRQAAAVARPEFPMDLAFRVAAMARASHGTEITATFSLRKMQMWAHVYLLLLKDGFAQKEAVGGAFHLAVLAKEYGECRTYLANAFNQVFGFKPALPAIPPERLTEEGGAQRHPASFALEPLLRAGLNVWLVGDTGSGKTYMVKDLVSRVLGRTYIRIQATGDMNVDDLLGGMGGKAGTTFFQYGPLPLAMGVEDGKGKTLLIDECSTAHADVLFELQAVLEGDALVLKKNRGQRILPAAGFHIVVCDNTLGLGEQPEYIGTKTMNEAFRDRFTYLHVDYMPEAAEKAIVERFITDTLTRTLTLVDQEVA